MFSLPEPPTSDDSNSRNATSGPLFPTNPPLNSNASNTEPPVGDVNLSVLGNGCAASFGIGCVGVVIIIALAAALGTQTVSRTSTLVWMGFPLGWVIHIASGYAVARIARAKNAAVDLHVLWMGAIFMIVGLLPWMLQQKNNVIAPEVVALSRVLGAINWLLTIPLMLVGASWAKEEK